MIQASPLAAIEEDLHKVEDALLEVAPPEHPQLKSVIANLISAGGKRIRPALVLLAGKFNDYDLERLVPGAVAIELLHTATLVHDDTIDSATVRRGKATVNSVLPNSVTILIGDFIFAQAAISAARPADPQVVTAFARTLREICDGELQQMERTHDLSLSREQYLQRVYAKTGALFACSTEIGALLSNAPQWQAQALRKYGERLGEAYQIIDDVLDFNASIETAGKPVGSDLRHGIPTLPTMLFLEGRAEEDPDSELVRSALRGDGEADYDSAIELVRDSGALDKSHEEARHLVDEAKAALIQMPACEARNSLYDIADYIVYRDR